MPETEGNAFTPDGYVSNRIEKGLDTRDPDNTKNFIRFYYKPGSLSKFGYSGGLIVNFNHIGPTNAGGIPANPNRNVRNNQGSVLVGTLGAPGSDSNLTGGSNNGYYVHSHMIFDSWDGRANSRPGLRTRVDPRSVFCNDLGF